METQELKDIEKYQKDFSDNEFWEKVKKYAKAAGDNVLEPALRMYYSLQDKDTPVWAKTTIIGALGYFISPIDAIPDLLPVVGYTDDLGVLTAAIAVVAIHIKEEHKIKAKELIKKWFG
jgi:uncharacterized membrane protein YkvA (DUF1232 family)